MKKILTKLLVCILIVTILNNFFFSEVSLAAPPVIDVGWQVITELVEGLFGAVIGVFAILPKMVVLPLCVTMQSLMAALAYSQGVVNDDGSINDGFVIDPNAWFLTPFDIIFNRVALVDVDIFNVNNAGSGAISKIRESVAAWYYVMRNIAAAILLCILIYVGIRMAISTVASDKATYKKMLSDWACSLALIFLIQYIIVATFAVNTAFVKMLGNVNKDSGLENAVLKLFIISLEMDVESIAATVAVCMLTWQTASLLISYINRMLKVSFLVIISPLITLTYSIDKMGDGKAQALNTWLKEFIYTVLLQVFHCVIYMAFVGIAMSILDNGVLPSLGLLEIDNNNLAAAILVVLCIHFTKEAEKIVGKIFGFNDSVSGASLATGMMATMALTKNAGKIAKGTRNVINGSKNFASKHGITMKNMRIGAGTVAGILAGKSRAEAKDQAKARVEDNDRKWQERLDEFKANRAERKVGTHYKTETSEKGKLEEIDTSKMTSKDQQDLYERAKAIKAENPNISDRSALARARAQKAEELRDSRNKSGKTNKGKQRKASKISSTFNELKQFAKESNTMDVIKEIAPAGFAMGLGVFAGAGSFGLGGDAMQSIMLGAGAYQGGKQFFETSTKNLATQNDQYAIAQGATSAKDSAEYFSGVIANGELYTDKASEQIDSLFDRIKAALGDLSESDARKLKSTIKNVVDKQLLDNPAATNAQIANAVGQNADVQAIVGPARMDAFKTSDGLGNMINFQRNAKVYENIQKAQSFGLNNDAFVADSIKAFEATARSLERDATSQQQEQPGEPGGGSDSGASDNGSGNNGSDNNPGSGDGHDDSGDGDAEPGTPPDTSEEAEQKVWVEQETKKGLDEARAEISRMLQDSSAATEHEIAMLREKIEQLVNDNEELQRRLGKERISTANLQELQQELDDLNTKLYTGQKL